MKNKCRYTERDHLYDRMVALEDTLRKSLHIIEDLVVLSKDLPPGHDLDSFLDDAYGLLAGE